MNQLFQCKRCGNKTVERLKTYSHCIDCFYVEDRHYDSESAYFQALAAEAFLDRADEDDKKDDEAAENFRIDVALESAC